MANSIWAFAQLNHQSSSELTHAVSYFILRHWQHMKAGDAVKALAALALLGGCPSTTWQLLLAKLASLPVSGLSQHELQQIFQMHLLLKAGGNPLLRMRKYSAQLIARSLSEVLTFLEDHHESYD